MRPGPFLALSQMKCAVAIRAPRSRLIPAEVIALTKASSAGVFPDISLGGVSASASGAASKAMVKEAAKALVIARIILPFIGHWYRGSDSPRALVVYGGRRHDLTLYIKHYVVKATFAKRRGVRHISVRRRPGGSPRQVWYLRLRESRQCRVVSVSAQTVSPRGEEETPHRRPAEYRVFGVFGVLHSCASHRGPRY